MKKFLMAASLGLTALAAFPTSSHAGCSLNGTIVKVWTADRSIFPGAYVYLRTNSALSHYYWGRINDTRNNVALITAATAAGANRTRVYIHGDTAFCPTSGRARFIGNIGYVTVSP